eukprot:gene27333-4630_t
MAPAKEDLEDGELEEGELPCESDDRSPTARGGRRSHDRLESSSPKARDRSSREHDRSPREHDKSCRENDKSSREHDKSSREKDRSARALVLDPKVAKELEEKQAARLEAKGKQELCDQLKNLTRHLSVQECMKSLSSVCSDLKAAIRKLDKLEAKTDSVESFPECVQYAGRVLEGLKSVNIVCGASGISQSLRMDDARRLFKTALEYSLSIFTAEQQDQLEGYVRKSKVFKSLLAEDPPQDAGSTGGGAEGAGGKGGKAGVQDSKGEQGGGQNGLVGSKGVAGAAGGGAAGGKIGSGGKENAPSPSLLLNPGQYKAASMQLPYTSSLDNAFGSGALSDDFVADIAAELKSNGMPQLHSQLQFQLLGRYPQPPPVQLGHTRNKKHPPYSPQPPPYSPQQLGHTRNEKHPPYSPQELGHAQNEKHPPYSPQPPPYSPQQLGHTRNEKPPPYSPQELGHRRNEKPPHYSPQAPPYSPQQRGHTRNEEDSPYSPQPLPYSPHQQRHKQNEEDSPYSPGSSPNSPHQPEHTRNPDPDPQFHEPELITKTQTPSPLSPASPPQQHGSETDRSSTPLPPDVAPILEESVAHLLSQGRLCLILDLDHTLLNSAFFSEVTPEAEAMLTQQIASMEAKNLPEASIYLFRLERLGLWTKLRPGVREFLDAAKDKFELWIHTNGNKSYADAMVELLDPTKELFGPRVIAQGTSNNGEEAGAATLSKRLMDGLEGREPVSVILDDSSAVWPHDRRNLLMVERYLYFPASRKKFGMEGKSLLEVNRDECSERGMLVTASRLLDRLHWMVLEYYNKPGKAPSMPPLDPSFPVWDMRNVMGEESRKVLAGVHIVFSRVIPLEQNPRTHTLWRLAEHFGATCSTQTSEATTHVIAATKGTEKTFWAIKNGRKVVTPSWLECSCIMWDRAAEERFMIP